MGRRVKGFSVTELLIGLAVASLIFVSFLKLHSSFQASTQNLSVEAKAERIGLAIQAVAENIIEIWKPYCTGVAGEENLRWGWRSSRCNQVRIFPQLPSVSGQRGSMVYTFNTGVLSSSDQARLLGVIRDAFSGVCNVDDSQVSAGSIRVVCPDFYAIRYCFDNNCNSLGK